MENQVALVCWFQENSDAERFRDELRNAEPKSEYPRVEARRAFTVVELLVVIAVIGILASMLLPALGTAKSRSQAVTCMNNSKQLMLAWNQYISDNNDKCVNNFGWGQIYQDLETNQFRNWVNDVMTWGASGSITDAGNTNVDWIKNGLLAKYVSGAVNVYKCPADNYLSSAQKAAGWKARLRSVSMNAYLGPFSPSLKDQSAQSNPVEPNYRQFLRMSQIPQPSMIFVTMEENANSINDGWFINKAINEDGWGDAPGSYHNGACGMAFADGHAEMRRWQGDWVNDRLVKVIPSAYPYGVAVAFTDVPGHHDFLWLWARTSVAISQQRAP